MRAALYCLVLVITVTGVTYGVSIAQNGSQGTLPTDPVALEIRQLRVAMQQAGGLSPRVQLALGRVSLAQQAIKEHRAMLFDMDTCLRMQATGTEARQGCEREHAMISQQLEAERTRLTDAQRLLDELQRELSQTQGRQNPN